MLVGPVYQMGSVDTLQKVLYSKRKAFRTAERKIEAHLVLREMIFPTLSFLGFSRLACIEGFSFYISIYIREIPTSAHQRFFYCQRFLLECATIIRPVQDGLPLSRATRMITASTIFHELRNMAPDRAPTTYLPFVFARQTSAHIVTTVPLKPTAWIIRRKPTLRPPHRERLRSIHAKIVECWIMPFRTEFRCRKPTRWKLIATVRHVLSAKDPERKHLGRS